MLADAGGTAAEISEFWHLASGISYLPLRSHNNNTMPLRVFTRRHYNVLEAGGTIRGGWRVVGASPGYPPNIAKIRLRIIRVCRINGVLIRMGRLKSPFDPSLIYTFLANALYAQCLTQRSCPASLTVRNQVKLSGKDAGSQRS